MISINLFEKKHTGKRAIVMGLGVSTNDILEHDLSEFVTIGVNDICKVYTPDYVLTVDLPGRFSKDRLPSITETKSSYLFTQLPEWKKYSNLEIKTVLFKLGDRKLGNIDRHGVLDYSNNSPYIGVLLAYQMGCAEIGLIGVDFTENHCHMQDGTHELMRNNRMLEIERDYSELHAALCARNCQLYNISGLSNLQAVPKMDMKKFLTK